MGFTPGHQLTIWCIRVRTVIKCMAATLITDAFDVKEEAHFSICLEWRSCWADSDALKKDTMTDVHVTQVLEQRDFPLGILNRCIWGLIVISNIIATTIATATANITTITTVVAKIWR